MASTRFGHAELYAGTRFLTPVSEATLLDAGERAGLREGGTLLDLACGNAAVSLLLAEEFHLYARGVEASADLVAEAQAHVQRSPAQDRVHVYHEDASHPDPGLGPVDYACALRGGAPQAAQLLRNEGRLIGGTFVVDDASPPELREEFAPSAPPPGEIVWRHRASPLEWERFFAHQERALRAYRARLQPGDPVSPIALGASRRIELFRAHAHLVSYEIYVAVVRRPQAV